MIEVAEGRISLTATSASITDMPETAVIVSIFMDEDTRFRTLQPANNYQFKQFGTARKESAVTLASCITHVAGKELVGRFKANGLRLHSGAITAYYVYQTKIGY